MKKFGVILCAVTWGYVVSAALPEGPDQDNLLDLRDGYFGPLVFKGVEQGQTFTVGSSGLLTQIVIQAFKDYYGPENPSLFTEPLILSIHTTLRNTVPSPTVLGSFSIPPEQLTGPSLSTHNVVSIDVSGAGIEVVAGQRLAIVMTSELPGRSSPPPNEAYYSFVTSERDNYAGGLGWYRDFLNPVPWTAQDYDFGFQTYVAPIPEPNTFTLLSLGSLALGTVGRRRWVSKHYTNLGKEFG
jgi:hypothetical protein